MAAPMQPIYRFGDTLIDDDSVEITDSGIDLPGYGRGVSLAVDNPYGDMV